MSPHSPVSVEWTAGDRCDVTLDDAASRNALSPALVDGLDAALDEAAADGARLVVLRSGTAVFSSGFDLRSVHEETDATLLQRFTRIGLLLEKLSNAPFMTVAVLDGPAIGAGADLVLACHHRIGTAASTFRFPGAAFGVVLGTRRLAALVGEARALELVTTGTALDAASAERLGLLRITETAHECDAWLTAQHTGVSRLPPGTLPALAVQARQSDGDSALAALVRSIAGRPGMRDRLARFAAAAPAGRSGTTRTSSD